MPDKKQKVETWVREQMNADGEMWNDYQAILDKVMSFRIKWGVDIFEILKNL